MLDSQFTETLHQNHKQVIEDGESVGPLHGVPIALKDLDSFIAGMPLTYGSKPFVDSVSDKTSVTVQRLLDAGAIVIGSTNTPAFGHRGDTTNPLFGATGNPFRFLEDYIMSTISHCRAWRWNYV